MSDVSSFTHLTDKICPDPYYAIVSEAENLIIEKFGQKVRGNYDLIVKASKNDGVLKELYRRVVELYGYNMLDSFKGNVKRRLRCFIAVDRNRNIVGWGKQHWPCKMKGCPRCGPYRASEYMRYPDEIALLGESNNRDEAVKIVQEMNKVFTALDIGYLVATTIPTYDDRHIISVACLRYQELNPLTDYNEVKEAIEIAEREYSFLERVDMVDSKNRYDSVYITHESKIQFSSTNLYESMPAGQGTSREKGKISGCYFDYDKMEVAYISKKDRQKKTDEDDGIIVKFNSPAANSNVPEDQKKTAIRRVIKRTSSHKERAAFPVDTPEDLAYQVNRFSAIYIEELEELGHPQPEVQVNIRLTQKDFDQFNSLVGIPKNGGVPDNILDIEFEDLNRKTYGIRDRVNLIRQRLLFETQQKLKNNITVEKLLNIIVGQIEVKPPG